MYDKHGTNAGQGLFLCAAIGEGRQGVCAEVSSVPGLCGRCFRLVRLQDTV